MTNRNNRALSEMELEAVSGGGQWVAPPPNGKWWIWKPDPVAAFNPVGKSSFHHKVDHTTGSNIRTQVVGGKTHLIRYDGKAEQVVKVY